MNKTDVDKLLNAIEDKKNAPEDLTRLSPEERKAEIEALEIQRLCWMPDAEFEAFIDRAREARKTSRFTASANAAAEWSARTDGGRKLV